MSITPLRVIVVAVILASAALLRPSDGRAQATATPPEVLAALLVEVRGLRTAMEQMASAGPRVQLAFGRLQLQEQRVNTLMRRLEDAKTNLAQAQRALDATNQRLAQIEGDARETLDPAIRRDLEHQVKAIRAETALAVRDVQRLQTEEATLSQEISNEQGRWNEINQRLEELERSLGRR